MKSSLLILPLFLSGCLWQTVDQNDIQSAIQICGGLDNVVNIDAHFDSKETVICTDRRKVYMNENALKQ